MQQQKIFFLFIKGITGIKNVSLCIYRYISLCTFFGKTFPLENIYRYI